MLVSTLSWAGRIDLGRDRTYEEINSENYFGLICGTDYFFAIKRQGGLIDMYSRVYFENAPIMYRWSSATWYPNKIVLHDAGWFGDANINRRTLKWGFTQCYLHEIPEWKKEVEKYLSELKTDNKI